MLPCISFISKVNVSHASFSKQILSHAYTFINVLHVLITTYLYNSVISTHFYSIWQIIARFHKIYPYVVKITWCGPVHAMVVTIIIRNSVSYNWLILFFHIKCQNRNNDFNMFLPYFYLKRKSNETIFVSLTFGNECHSRNMWIQLCITMDLLCRLRFSGDQAMYYCLLVQKISLSVVIWCNI